MPLNYEQIFGDDFVPILQAIDKGLPNQVEKMLLGQIDKMMFQVNLFSDNISKTVATLRESGASVAQISSVLGQDMATGGKIFGPLRNSVKEEVVNGMNQASRLGQFEEYGTRDKFAWVVVGGHKICPDCDARAGEIKSYDKWTSEGLPGTGWSVCGGYCYCILDPIGRIDKKVEVARKEKIRAEKGATIKPLGEQRLRYQTARSSAKRLKKNAIFSESGVTTATRGIVEGAGGEMRGLQWRLKGQESLARKLMTYNKNQGTPLPIMLAEEINDVIRYTGVFASEVYSAQVAAVVAQMEAEGYKVLLTKNKWGDNGYRGLHYIFRSPTKHKFELQFHTKKSIFVKEEFSHPLYEEMRSVLTSEARISEIEKILLKEWSKVTPPPGWEQFI